MYTTASNCLKNIGNIVVLYKRFPIPKTKVEKYLFHLTDEFSNLRE